MGRQERAKMAEQREDQRMLDFSLASSALGQLFFGVSMQKEMAEAQEEQARACFNAWAKMLPRRDVDSDVPKVARSP